jgi:hypothetical protein
LEINPCDPQGAKAIVLQLSMQRMIDTPERFEAAADTTMGRNGDLDTTRPTAGANSPPTKW